MTFGSLRIFKYDASEHPISCNYCHRDWLDEEAICQEVGGEPTLYWHPACHLSYTLGIPPKDKKLSEHNELQRHQAVKTLLPPGSNEKAIRFFSDFSKAPVCSLKRCNDEDVAKYRALTGIRTGHDTFKLVLKEIREKMSILMESPITPLPSSRWLANMSADDRKRVLAEGDKLRSYLMSMLDELAKKQVKESSIIGGQNRGMIIDARYIAALYLKILEALVARSGFHTLENRDVEQYCEAIKIASRAAPRMQVEYMSLCVSVDTSASFWSEETRTTVTGHPPEDWLQMYDLAKKRLNVQDPFLLAMMATLWVTAGDSGSCRHNYFGATEEKSRTNITADGEHNNDLPKLGNITAILDEMDRDTAHQEGTPCTPPPSSPLLRPSHTADHSSPSSPLLSSPSLLRASRRPIKKAKCSASEESAYAPVAAESMKSSSQRGVRIHSTTRTSTSTTFSERPYVANSVYPAGD